MTVWTLCSISALKFPWMLEMISGPVVGTMSFKLAQVVSGCVSMRAELFIFMFFVHLWCFRIVVLEKTLERPLDCKEIKPVNPKGNQSWIFIRRTDVEAEAPILWPPDAKSWLIHWKRPWCWETLRAREEGGDRGRDGWMVSLTQWTWVWTNSRRRWRTGKPDVLQAMGSQRVRCDWVTEQGLRCGMWDLELWNVGSSSLTVSWAWALCTGKVES